MTDLFAETARRVMRRRLSEGEQGVLIVRVGRVPGNRDEAGPWHGQFRGQRARIAQVYGRAFVRGYARAFVRAYGKTSVRGYGKVCARAPAEVFVPAFAEAFARAYAEAFVQAYVEGYAEARAAMNEATARVILRHRGTEVSAAFPEDLPTADRATLAQASPATVAAAAIRADSVPDFLHRLREGPTATPDG